ncbi:MAG: UDP-glucose dehydrogenase family protein [Dehalococcoidia bacterium]
MSERAAVIGVGRIGAVTAVGLAHLGHEVTGIDRDEGRVAGLSAGQLREREPGLRAALQTALAHRGLTFSRSAARSAFGVAFLCVDTPPLATGEPDLRQVFAAAEDAATLLRRGGTLVTRSTVTVGTGDRLVAHLAQIGRSDVAVVHAPEFLREGTAWEDFREPDRLVFGADRLEDAAAVAALFENLDRPVFLTSRRTAELAKYAANAFLAMSISFANEMSDLSATVGADESAMFAILRADRRIGKHAYLTPGLGFGGHCLPKDTAALEHLATMHGRPMPLLHATRQLNAGRIGAAVAWLRDGLAGLNGKRICLAGLAFKPGTDDTRESPALHLARLLALEGVTVTGFDPEVALDGPFVTSRHSLLEAAEGADALVIAHANAAWRELQPDDVAHAMRGRLVFDAPAILDAPAWRRAGLRLNRPEKGGRRRHPAPAGRR